VNDTDGHPSYTETREITLDTIINIEVVPPTPGNATNITDTFVEINVSIEEINLANLTFNWNGTNTTFRNEELNYGTSIQSSYATIYTTNTLSDPVSTTPKDNTYNYGNCDYTNNVFSGVSWTRVNQISHLLQILLPITGAGFILKQVD